MVAAFSLVIVAPSLKYFAPGTNIHLNKVNYEAARNE